MNRRQLLMGAAGATLGSLAIASPPAAAPAGFPTYKYLGVPFDKAALRYNPTNELIFPCIRGVYDKISSPLGRDQPPYAPHDAPGGICLAYGDSLAGPFTEYPGNPIVKNVWQP